MFTIRFDEPSQSFEITNTQTGKMASIPDPKKLWIPDAKAEPNMFFFEQNGLLIYTRGDYYDPKEIGIWDKDNNWVCILQTQEDLIRLKDMSPDPNTNTIHLVGKSFEAAHNFAHNEVNTEQLRFEFYDLDTEQKAVFDAMMLQEPDKDWHVSFSDISVDAGDILRPLDERLNKWERDFKLLGSASVKHRQTEIQAEAGGGYLKLFKCPQNDEGYLFEFWYTRFKESWSHRFERYHEAALLDCKDTFFFRKRADIDEPLHSDHGIDVFYTPDGLQIEDKARNEVYYYVPDTDLLIRARIDWESLPISMLHDQFQTMDVDHPGYMPCVEYNHSGGCDKERPVNMIDLTEALQNNNYALLTSTLAERNYDYTDMVEHKAESTDDAWTPFPETPTHNWWYDQRHRTIYNYEPERGRDNLLIFSNIMSLEAS